MLLETYHRLANSFPDACPHLFGEKIKTAEGLWLSLDAQGHPYLLFEMETDDGQLDLKLKSIEVRFACPCDLQLENGIALSGLYTLVCLSNEDHDIIRVFLRLLEETFLAPGADHSAKAIREQILSIADLFTRLDVDIKDVLGLWGELHIIGGSQNLRKAVRSWSSSHNARYDFITDEFGIEVKSTLKPLRIHRFSLEQLRPSWDIQVFVASIVLVETTGGASVGELVDQIYEALGDPEERRHFLRLCLRKGGADIYASDLRLRPLPNSASVLLFDGSDLPTPSVQADDPMTNVRFDLNLSALQPLDEDIQRNVLSFRT